MGPILSQYGWSQNQSTSVYVFSLTFGPGKGKLVGTLFSAPRGAHFLFTSDWARLLNIVRGLPVLCTASLLPSQPRPVPIYTPGSRGASYNRVPFSRTQPAATQGSNPQLWNQASVALPLSYTCLYLLQLPCISSWWGAIKCLDACSWTQHKEGEVTLGANNITNIAQCFYHCT